MGSNYHVSILSELNSLDKELFEYTLYQSYGHIKMRKQ